MKHWRNLDEVGGVESRRRPSSRSKRKGAKSTFSATCEVSVANDKNEDAQDDKIFVYSWVGIIEKSPVSWTWTAYRVLFQYNWTGTYYISWKSQFSIYRRVTMWINLANFLACRPTRRSFLDRRIVSPTINRPSVHLYFAIKYDIEMKRTIIFDRFFVKRVCVFIIMCTVTAV